MKWTRGYRSRDVIDRRDQGPTGGGVGPEGFFLLARLLPRLGIPGVVVLLLLVGLVVFGGRSGLIGGAPVDTPQERTDDPASFVAFVLDDVQKSWAAEFAERGDTYQPAELVLFTGSTPSACGLGTAATGPFYCPNDERVYIDLGFYQELSQRFGAKGDFAEAYVIAHEIGHHVQRQLGGEGGPSPRRPPSPHGDAGASSLPPSSGGGPARGETGNAASIRRELQADCLAGVWARSAEREGLVEPGDIEEGLGAAAAVGDDRIQRQETGTVSPESWTHGSAADRSRWFRTGYQAGAPEACSAAAPS